jgi:nucleotide-binding universal stress UspA family protein
MARRAAGHTFWRVMEPSALKPNEEEPLAAREGVFGDCLCAVDGTRGSFAAVEQAAQLVGSGGQLTLLAVTGETGSGQYKTAAISPQRVDRVLGRAAELAQSAGALTARIVDAEHPPAEAILREAAGHELLAMGAPAASPLGALFVGSVAAATLGSASTPMLAARPHRGAEPAPRVIVVASDGSQSSAHVVALAGRLARAQGARIVLVHAIGEESHAHPHRIEQQARELDLAAAGASELRVLVGHPLQAIVETAASSDASLVLVGTRRLPGSSSLGSVSQHVVHAAPCSVLLVPPEPTDEP